MSAPSLKIIYFAFFHSVMSYGIIFWGNSWHSSIIFRLQKNVVCLTEHHLREQEIENLSIAHYTLRAKFCRQNLKQGGTGIFVHESLAFTNIDLQNYCMEQDIETCQLVHGADNLTTFMC